MANGQTVKNLTSITWSHATNSQKLLNEVLSCKLIKFIPHNMRKHIIC